jgi:GntR family histidine utilization transcriptional repressor
VTANEWLLGHVPYTTGDIGLSAAAASPAEAAIMEVAPGAALFVLDRTTWDADCPVTLVRQIYAPGYRMQTSL